MSYGFLRCVTVPSHSTEKGAVGDGNSEGEESSTVVPHQPHHLIVGLGAIAVRSAWWFAGYIGIP